MNGFTRRFRLRFWTTGTCLLLLGSAIGCTQSSPLINRGTPLPPPKTFGPNGSTGTVTPVSPAFNNIQGNNAGASLNNNVSGNPNSSLNHGTMTNLPTTRIGNNNANPNLPTNYSTPIQNQPNNHRGSLNQAQYQNSVPNPQQNFAPLNPQPSMNQPSYPQGTPNSPAMNQPNYNQQPANNTQTSNTQYYNGPTNNTYNNAQPTNQYNNAPVNNTPTHTNPYNNVPMQQPQIPSMPANNYSMPNTQQQPNYNMPMNNQSNRGNDLRMPDPLPSSVTIPPPQNNGIQQTGALVTVPPPLEPIPNQTMDLQPMNNNQPAVKAVSNPAPRATINPPPPVLNNEPSLIPPAPVYPK